MIEPRQQILEIENKIREIESTNIQPEFREGIVKSYKVLLANLNEFLPLFENMEAVRNQIVTPTSEKLDSVFSTLNTRVEKANKSSFSLGVLSIIIGAIFSLIGIFLSVSSSLPSSVPSYSLRNNLDSYLARYSWTTKVTYAYEKPVFDKTDYFRVDHLSTIHGVQIKIETNTNLKSVRDFEQQSFQLELVINTTKKIMESYTADRIEWTSINKYVKGPYLIIELIYANETLKLPDILYKRSELCMILSPNYFSKFSDFKFDDSEYGVQKEVVISEIGRLVSLISGEKFVFDSDFTEACKLYIDGDGDYFPSFFLKKRKEKLSFKREVQRSLNG